MNQTFRKVWSRWVPAVLLLVTCFTTLPVVVAESETLPATLSSYWNYKIQRWDSLIIDIAQERQLDPDFLASLVWMESRGDNLAVGPVGAVGLTQVMPKEAGFTWRPTREVLFDPYTNLFWGSRTLATVLCQGKGDVFNSLAAYNGGWHQTMYRGPTIFATSILRDYAHAVVARYDYTGPWVAFFARKDLRIEGPIRIADSERKDVYFYGQENSLPDSTPLIPDVPPTSIISYSVDKESGEHFLIGIWVYAVDTNVWLNGYVHENTRFLLERDPGTEPPPTSTPNAHPAGQAPMIATQPTATEDVKFLDPVPNCAGGDLAVDAWPLHHVIHPKGWSVTVFAEGHGGDCRYTYAWNDDSELKAVGVTGPVTFEIFTDRRDAAIIGTVVVMSAGETVRVPLYIPSPKK